MSIEEVWRAEPPQRRWSLWSEPGLVGFLSGDRRASDTSASSWMRACRWRPPRLLSWTNRDRAAGRSPRSCLRGLPAVARRMPLVRSS